MDHRRAIGLWWAVQWSILIGISFGRSNSDNQLRTVQTIVALVWMGMLSAISFMEAWVKFEAPLLTRAVGVDVGRRVFRALNAAEVSHCAAMACVELFLNDRNWFRMALLVASLCFQLLWLMPALDQNVVWRIATAPAEDVPASRHAVQASVSPSSCCSSSGSAPRHVSHGLYLGLEVVKFILLFSFSLGLMLG